MAKWTKMFLKNICPKLNYYNELHSTLNFLNDLELYESITNQELVKFIS